mgnify:CR=1 FL=1
MVSVPYPWLGNAPGHINDPDDEVKLEGWMGVAPNAWQVVQEPFLLFDNFPHALRRQLRTLGSHVLRGVREPVEVFVPAYPP